MEPTTGRKEKEIKREQVKGSDLTCAAEAMTFVGVWARNILRSLWNNTSVIPQVETGRWSSQRQAAWCQLIWRDAAAAAAAGRAELRKRVADLEEDWNSTTRSRIKISGEGNRTVEQSSILLRSVLLIYSTFNISVSYTNGKSVRVDSCAAAMRTLPIKPTFNYCIYHLVSLVRAEVHRVDIKGLAATKADCCIASPKNWLLNTWQRHLLKCS